MCFKHLLHMLFNSVECIIIEHLTSSRDDDAIVLLIGTVLEDPSSLS